MIVGHAREGHEDTLGVTPATLDDLPAILALFDEAITWLGA